MGGEDRTMSQLSCRKCGYVWHPRKASTLFRRQCPKCNSSDFDVANSASQTPNNPAITPTTNTSTDNNIFAQRTKLPPVLYDLMGLSGATCPEEALKKSFELYRKIAQYKWKYNLTSPDEVVEFLEKKYADDTRRANEAEKRVKELLDSPELIFLETVGADLDAVNWFEHEQRKGYEGSFLDFISEIVGQYYRDRGLELPEPEE